MQSDKSIINQPTRRAGVSDARATPISAYKRDTKRSITPGVDKMEQHEKAGKTAKEEMQHEKVNIVKTAEEAMQQRLPFHHWFSTIRDDATAQQSINKIK